MNNFKLILNNSKIKDLLEYKIYVLHYGDENVTEIDVFSKKEEAMSCYNDIGFKAFNDEFGVNNYKELFTQNINIKKIEKLIKEKCDYLSDSEEVIDTVISEFEDDYTNFIDEEADLISIKYEQIKPANEATDDMIIEIIDKLGLEGQYTELGYLTTDNIDYSINIRIADHSWHISNNKSSHNFSFVIANEDVTSDKFLYENSSNAEQFVFDENYLIEDICDFIKRTVKNHVERNSLTRTEDNNFIL